MKKTLFVFFIALCTLSLNAQVPDLNSISSAQKIAYLKSLSASDRALLLKELQNGAASEAEPLE